MESYCNANINQRPRRSLLVPLSLDASAINVEAADECVHRFKE